MNASHPEHRPKHRADRRASAALYTNSSTSVHSTTSVISSGSAGDDATRTNPTSSATIDPSVYESLYGSAPPATSSKSRDTADSPTMTSQTSEVSVDPSIYESLYGSAPPTSSASLRNVTAPVTTISPTYNLSAIFSDTTPTSSTFAYNASITIAPSGTGIVYASACNALSDSWSSARTLAVKYSVSSWTEYNVFTQTSFLSNNLNGSSMLQTLCPGQPPYWFGPLSDVYATLTTSSGNARVTTSYQPFTVPEPKCSIAPDDCTLLAEQYSSYALAKLPLTTFADGDILPPYPACSTTTSSTSNCSDCYISAGQVQLYYWPVSTKGGNICAGNGSTMTMTETIAGEANTVVSGQYTFTSPTVYISFESLNAGLCGSTMSTGLVSMAPESLLSIRFLPTPASLMGDGNPVPLTTGPFSFATADLNSPPPWSAYQFQQKCVDGGLAPKINH